MNIVLGSLLHNPETHFRCGHKRDASNIIVKSQNGSVKWHCRQCKNEGRRINAPRRTG